jgi:hypothetical protein
MTHTDYTHRSKTLLCIKFFLFYSYRHGLRFQPAVSHWVGVLITGSSTLLLLGLQKYGVCVQEIYHL